MKNLFFLSAFLFILNTNAQQPNTFPNTGNVGIGTLNPNENLEVIGNVKADKAYVGKTIPDGALFNGYADRNQQCKVVGFGTEASPNSHMLNIYDFPQSNYNAQSSAFISMNDRNDFTRWRFYANTGGLSQLYYYNKNQSHFYSLKEDGNSNVFLTLPFQNSYLSIGTNSYSDNGELYKLTVNGKVRANSVKVYTDWADFVFQDNYNLPSLIEVERFIKKNGHLKNIPSAEEVERNGIELGEMNKLLLQKIEELTLYTIELKKEIDTINMKIK